MTTHVELRAIDEVDAAIILEAVEESRNELMRWMPWCTPEFGLSDVTQFQKRVASERSQQLGIAFGILDTDGAFCGTCGLNAVTGDRVANLGYWVRSTRTRSGFATAAVRQLAAWAFEHTDLQRLEIVAAEANTISQRVAERSGALREAILRRRLKLHDSQVNAVMYSLVR